MKKNSWSIIGNLGTDPQTAVTASGKTVANLSVALNEGRKGRDGVWRGTTHWVKVECWDAVYKYASRLRKGQTVLVEGRFRPDTLTYEGKELQRTTLVARSILLLASSGNSEIEGVSTDPETHTLTTEARGAGGGAAWITPRDGGGLHAGYIAESN